jgi:hypothetical protein
MDFGTYTLVFYAMGLVEDVWQARWYHSYTDELLVLPGSVKGSI